MQSAIYLRVSTEEQVSGYGLDVQRERCTAMATVKGWTVAPEHIYCDEGISGTKNASGRPGLAALLAAAEHGTIAAVIVLALDRLGRKTTIVLDLVDTLARAGVQLVSCKESLDTSTPAGQFVLTMFAALAQLERDTIVERTTAGRNARGKRDGEKGGRVPYGYQRSAGGVVVEPVAAAVVRQILRWHYAGATYQAIADRLNERGDTPPRGGRVWYRSSIGEIVRNGPIYRGGARGASAVAWPALVSSPNTD